MTAPGMAQSIRAALALESSEQVEEALSLAWALLDAAPDAPAIKALIARLLDDRPELITADRESSVARLLVDPRVDPRFIGAAGWALIRRGKAFPRTGSAADPEEMAGWLEGAGFARTLLEETFVTDLAVEEALTALRRWLLLSGYWSHYPQAVNALAAQATLNGGAWLVDAEETRHLTAEKETPIALAYAPQVIGDSRPLDFPDPITRAVAGQYEGWPYPQWSRVMVSRQSTLPAVIRKLDPDGPDSIPLNADILVAGCGTGREAALCARQFPDARIMAIDLSEASLRYAADRCTKAGLDSIDFRLLDLHQASILDRRFDAIFCSGVLHHLPDPESGWDALVGVLRPGGAMRVMVYSKVARLRIRAAQTLIADLAEQPVDGDLLRAVRRRLIETAPHLVAGSIDFYTLAGVHDLLLHRQEVAFDVPGIADTIRRLGLKLVAFSLPNRAQAARYRARNPSDPLFRDVAAWASLERENPFLFSRMYDFWCRKPLC